MKKTIMLALIILMAVASASDAIETDAGDIHGFISQGYLQSDENNFLADTKDGTFQFREMGINFRTTLTPSASAGFQIFARDLGDIGNNEGEVDWAYIDYQYRKWLGVRVGKFKSPFGLYNESRDIDMARVSVLLPQGVYNEGWRDSLKSKTGVELYGRVGLNKLGNVSYQVQAGEMDLEPDGGIAKFVDGQSFMETQDFDTETTYAAALRWDTPLEGLKIGGTANWFDYDQNLVTLDSTYWRNATVYAFYLETMMWVDYDTAKFFGVDMVGLDIEAPMENFYWVLSVEYVWNNLTLAAEYAKDEVYFEFHAPEPYGILQERSFFLEGYYASAAYRFTDWFELGTYYSVFYPDASDKSGTATAASFDIPEEVNWSKDICISTRFDVFDNWVFKLEAHSMDGLAVMYILDQDTNTDGSLDVETGSWYLLAAKMTYSF